jgi:hypothetical protein
MVVVVVAKIAIQLQRMCKVVKKKEEEKKHLIYDEENYKIER